MADSLAAKLIVPLMTMCVFQAPPSAAAIGLAKTSEMNAAMISCVPASLSKDLPRRSENQIAIDAGFLTASVSYARTWQGPWLLGGGGGISGDFFGYMVFAGRHYAEHGGWSYEEKDGFRDKSLIDLIHANLFARYVGARWLQTDIGIRGSIFMHFDSSDDDAGSGYSAGIYVNPMIGWRSFRLGPTAIIGGFWGCRDAREFGVFISPLQIRAIFSW